MASAVGISYGIIQAVMMTGVTEKCQQQRLQVCQWMLIRDQADGVFFCNGLLPAMRMGPSENKQTTMQWKKKENTVKIKTRFSAEKVLMTVFWNFSGSEYYFIHTSHH